jgi:hypothetical protein
MVDVIIMNSNYKKNKTQGDGKPTFRRASLKGDGVGDENN